MKFKYPNLLKIYIKFQNLIDICFFLNGTRRYKILTSANEGEVYRVLVSVLNQQSATISLHFTRLAIAPGQRYSTANKFLFILMIKYFHLRKNHTFKFHSELHSSYDHTSLDTPDPIRTLKLSNDGPT